ncbi:9377_t:CDS:2, partial [Racocetra fulgida]
MSTDAYFEDLTYCSLLGFLEHKRPTEKDKAYSLYKGTLSFISKDDTIKSERRTRTQACLKHFKEQADLVAVKQYWMDLKKKQLEDLISLEESLHVLDATKDTRNQGHLLRNTITKIIEKRSTTNHILKENNALKSNPLNIRNDNVANAYSKGTSSEKVKEPQENGKSACKDNLKRKRDDDDEPDYEELSLLFDESNEDALVECIDEKVLEQENILPQDQQKNIDTGIVESFYKYQKTIPKTQILDLNGESLYDCKNLTTEVILQLSQEFAEKNFWKTMPPEKNIREYFDANCAKNADDNHNIEKLDGEVQALSTNYARNEKASPFKKARIGRRVDMKSTLIKTTNKFEIIYGEVSGGLGPLRIPTACRKKRAGIYRFGLVDRCRLPSDEDEFGILEDAYCILKLLE